MVNSRLDLSFKLKRNHICVEMVPLYQSVWKRLIITFLYSSERPISLTAIQRKQMTYDSILQFCPRQFKNGFLFLSFYFCVPPARFAPIVSHCGMLLELSVSIGFSTCNMSILSVNKSYCLDFFTFSTLVDFDCELLSVDFLFA